MARVLDTASVRIVADVRDGEREAAAAGENFGREFAAGADRTGASGNLPGTLAKQVSDASQQVVAARREETAATAAAERASGALSKARDAEENATGRVRVAETNLNDVRSRGTASATQLASAEERVASSHRNLEQASAAVTRAEDSVASSSERLRTAHVATVDATQRHTSALRELGNATEETGGKIRGLGNDSDRGVSAMDRLRGAGSSVTEVFRGGLVGNLAPFILPAVASIGALSGALALLPALAAGAGATLGALLVGASGVTGAFKAFTAQSEAAGTSVAKTAAQTLASANTIISAQNAVRDAVQGVADAQRNATSSILAAQEAVTSAVQAQSNAVQTASANNVAALQSEQRAEESLTSAQQSALRAQQNLTDARESAARSIEDLQNRVADDALAQRHAVDQLTTATANLATVQANPTATAAQREQAQLAADDARQHLKEISLSYQRSQEDAAKAAAAGVDGSKQVVSAQDQVIASQKAVRDATTAVGDAQAKVVSTQVAGQQSVQAATQRVADTQRALTDAQINGAERVVKAQEGVVSAQRALQVALAQSAASAESAAGSTDKFNTAMAKLAPNAQGFVRAVLGLGPAWKDLKLDVQQRLFAGLGDQIRAIGAADLPVLRVGLGLMATSLNGVITQFTAFATSRSAISDSATIFANSAKAVDNFKGAIQPILRIFTDLAVVGSSFLPQLAQHFADAAKRAADFMDHARETGQLHTFIQGGIDAFRQLWLITKDVIAIFADLVKQPTFGPSLLDDIQFIVAGLRWFIELGPVATTALEGVFILWRLAPLAKGISNIIELYRLLVPKIAAAAVATDTLTVSETAAGTAATTAGAKMEAASVGAGKFSGALKVVGVALGAYLVGQGLLAVGNDNAGTSFKNLAQDGADTAGKLLTLDLGGVATKIGRDWNALPDDLNTAQGRISTAWDAIKGVFTGADSWLYNSGRAVINGLGRGITDASAAVWSFITAIPGNIGGVFSGADNWLYNGGLAILNGLGRGIVSAAGPVWNFITGIPGNIARGIGDLSTLLWNSGASLVTGFLNGIKANWDRIVSWVESGMTELRSLWPFSPAKTGPFSGTGYVTYSGAALTRDFGNSILKGIPGVVAAARQLAQATVTAGTVDLTAAITTGAFGSPVGVKPLLAAARTAATPDLAAHRSGSVSVVQNIYNPSVTDATDSSNRELRRFAAMGGFTR